jgi:hypothetical protein
VAALHNVSSEEEMLEARAVLEIETKVCLDTSR